MDLVFVLTRYGKTHRQGDGCHEGRCSRSQISRNRNHDMSHRLGGRTRVGQEAEEQGKSMGKASIVVFMAGKGQGTTDRLGIG